MTKKLTAAIEGHNEAGRHLLLRAETAECNEALLTMQLAEAQQYIRTQQRYIRTQDAVMRVRVAELEQYNAGLAAQLAEARALLEGLRRELEDRGGDLSRKTWNRLEVYCDDVLAANPEPPRAARAVGPAPDGSLLMPVQKAPEVPE